MITAALDEAMGWAVYVATGGKMFLTWELEVRFLKPVSPGATLTVEAEFGETERAYHTASGKLVDDEGAVFARARGKYVTVSEAEARDVLGYPDGEM